METWFLHKFRRGGCFFFLTKFLLRFKWGLSYGPPSEMWPTPNVANARRPNRASGRLSPCWPERPVVGRDSWVNPAHAAELVALYLVHNYITSPHKNVRRNREHGEILFATYATHTFWTCDLRFPPRKLVMRSGWLICYICFSELHPEFFWLKMWDKQSRYVGVLVSQSNFVTLKLYFWKGFLLVYDHICAPHFLSFHYLSYPTYFVPIFHRNVSSHSEC